MVLWEITLGTAYFLGLRRTYRLALKIQRRLISPKHPRIREFLHRRTCSVFHVAVSVHQKVQERDLEVGRNLGNWILRWLDQMKPSAQIRVSHPGKPLPVNNTKNIQPSGTKGLHNRMTDRGSRGGGLFATLWNRRPKSFPTIGMMIRPPKPTSLSGQYRHLSIPPAMKYWKSGFEGVFRRDIAQWMLQN